MSTALSDGVIENVIDRSVVNMSTALSDGVIEHMIDRSVVNMSTALSDGVIEHYLNILIITNIWLNQRSNDVAISRKYPPGKHDPYSQGKSLWWWGNNSRQKIT